MKLSIIIPAYNEENIIFSNINEIINHMKKLNPDYELIVVDDGSTDSTLKEVKRIKNKKIKAISYMPNKGKGYAVKKGVLASKGGLILVCDADLSTPINELDKFLKYADEYDIIIGSRALKESRILIKQPYCKILLGKLGNLMIRVLAVHGIKDTQCGFKLFKSKAKELFERQAINRWGWDFEILFMAQRKGYKIKELPVSWLNRKESRVKMLDYPKTLLELIRIRMNSLMGKYD